MALPDDWLTTYGTAAATFVAGAVSSGLVLLKTHLRVRSDLRTDHAETRRSAAEDRVDQTYSAAIQRLEGEVKRLSDLVGTLFTRLDEERYARQKAEDATAASKHDLDAAKKEVEAAKQREKMLTERVAALEEQIAVLQNGLRG